LASLAAKKMRMSPKPDTALALYIHIPFCRTKCPYCDFSSYSGLEGLIPRYVEALEAEAAFWARSRGRLPVATIYFGGGTPSLLSGEQVNRILEACRNSFRVAPGAEITLEANPDSAHDALLKHLPSMGVNRRSLGVQSFEPDLLKTLGRLHTAEQARDALWAARRAGFHNINLDLMYGLPGQSLERWRNDLEQALELAPEHISLYPLTLEADTPLGREAASGRLSLPESDLVADMYIAAETVLGQAGYEHYEISNWARPGHRCHHNLFYWQNRPYLGLGASAHSCFQGYRFSNENSPQEYIERLESGLPRALDGGSYPGSVAQVERIDRDTEIAETLILGLRLVEGIELEGFARRFGAEVSSLYPGKVEELIDSGLLEPRGSRLRLTQRGRLLGNEVFMRFLPDSR